MMGYVTGALLASSKKTPASNLNSWLGRKRFFLM